jgi:hypothetical protein
VSTNFTSWAMPPFSSPGRWPTRCNTRLIVKGGNPISWTPKCDLVERPRHEMPARIVAVVPGRLIIEDSVSGHEPRPRARLEPSARPDVDQRVPGIRHTTPYGESVTTLSRYVLPVGPSNRTPRTIESSTTVLWMRTFVAGELTE